ncbi:hypothetical protein PCASD_06852 [Puccinia coronata f. sp. avenae]|uniref:Uncharacterized protein n=1 Tax=Puccinia coronata f. sp. avenae TaxID=200324 RepID=A0A2N5UQA2_9BASI|nr:hypothetical protein PCASD_06852 [Puccinia coronata f. sp. avenae]
MTTIPPSSYPFAKTRLRPLLPGHPTRCTVEAKVECALWYGTHVNPRRAQVDQTIRTTACSQLRCTKVLPRIGALHFKTMEPYRQDQQVYDPEDELDDDHHAWRQFRADVRCERTSQLSIVKMQIPSAQMDGMEAGLSGRGIMEELLRIWNAHIRSIAPRPSASGSVMLSKAHYIASVKLLVTRFHPNPLAPDLLRHFLNRPHLTFLSCRSPPGVFYLTPDHPIEIPQTDQDKTRRCEGFLTAVVEQLQGMSHRSVYLHEQVFGGSEPTPPCLKLNSEWTQIMPQEPTNVQRLQNADPSDSRAASQTILLASSGKKFPTR